MTDREKIRAEVQRLKDEGGIGLNEYDMGYENGKGELCNHLLHFIDSLPEEPAPKESDDLEKAAIDFADNARKKLFTKDYAISSIADYDHGCIDGFIAGAEWQKRKMMEEVESGEVSAVFKFDNIVTINVVHGRLNTPLYLRLSKYKGLKEGDKVKLIIVKEEEQ